MTKTPQSKPRAITKATAKAVLVYFPEAVVAAVDDAVRNEDTDRSKWVRLAIREALQRRGISHA
jgi:metal-responsive CopG/Arc/MetJ family transcriptional regulator